MKKRTLLLLCTLLLLPLSMVMAKDDPPVATGKKYSLETVPNVRLSNVMSHVSDPDGIIGPAYTARIDSVLNAVEDSTGCQVAVVALFSIGDVPPREFANELFKKWGIGKKGEDNGLLILLLTNKDERSVTFETGYGIEGDLPDAICKRIQMQYMIPEMSNRNFGAGMYQGVVATAHILLGYEGVVGDEGSDEGWGAGDFTVLAIFLSFLSFALIGPVRSLFPKRCPNCGKRHYKRISQRITIQPTYSRRGNRHEVWRCSSCGYTMEYDHPLSKLSNHSNGGGFPGGTWGGGGSSWGGGSSGGSWGGGGSGGGGASTRF